MKENFMLRFAEHMLLASKVHGLVAYKRHDLQDRRCALGLVEGPGVADLLFLFMGVFGLPC